VLKVRRRRKRAGDGDIGHANIGATATVLR